MLPRTATGIVMQLISGAATSGVESNRIQLQSPLSLFGLSMTMASTGMTGLCGVTLYGTASLSTSVTTAQAETLISASSDSGATFWSSTANARLPVSQVWAVVTDAATSATANIDAWMAGVP